ncbi:hypothetical protein JAAARDRAFT_112935, partial [Jaapia argillacea MUCL 33604]
RRFECLGNITNIDNSIRLREDAVQLTPDDHPDKADHLNNLGAAFLCRFECLGNITDMDNSIRVREEADAVRLTPNSHPDKPGHLSNLSASLLRYFEHLSNITDINNSIWVQEDAVRLTPNGHTDKPGHLSNLGASLFCRFERLSNMTDMDNSIRVQEDAVQLTPDGHLLKAHCLNNLSGSLLHRFEHLGNMTNMDDSIRVRDDVVQLTPDGHPNKPGHLINLGASLLHRFKRLGNITDINNSIRVLEDAVRLTPDGHPYKPVPLNNLAGSLLRRFEHLGNITDIDHSIRLQEDVAQLTPDGHPNKPRYLNNLSTLLLRRFEHLGNITDIDNSIWLGEDAMQLTPDGHPNNPGCLSNLGASLLRHFECLGNITDIDHSIRVDEDAVQLTPDGHPDKPVRLRNLSFSLLRCFERLSNIIDIDNSIRLGEDAIQLTPDGHPDNPGHLSTLGASLFRRFERHSNVTDINNSIRVLEDAMQLTPDGHPDMPHCLYNLGGSLHLCFECLSHITDIDNSIRTLSTATQSDVGSPFVRFRAGITWARQAQKTRHTSLLTAYSTLLTLLHQLAWLGLPMHERHRELTGAGHLVRHVALAAIEAGQFETAVEWLEQGCSVVWGQLLQLRTPIDELQQVQPQLAARFTQGSNRLRQTSTPSHTSEAAKAQHTKSRKKIVALRTRQAREEMNDFLVPATPCKLFSDIPFAHLREYVCVAVESEDRSGLARLWASSRALNITTEDFTISSTAYSESGRLVPSERGCRRKESPGPNSMLEQVLAQLWEHVVKPVLDGLAFTSPPHANNLPHIWWCPNGPLAFLPIHAAGIYGTSEPGNCISDFVISSYTPTLSALINSHIRMPPNHFKLSVVAQSDASGGVLLSGTQEEMTLIQKQAEHRGVISESLTGAAATMTTVLHHMQQSNWVHFACHGVQERENPMDSGLLLADGRLKLSTIIDQSLPNAELSFLSACQTATGTADLSEESVHLAAGMLLAGYRGVVATMWSIGGMDAPRIADDFYAHVLGGEKPDHTQAAFGLHQAVQRLRSGGASFLSWVLYIHIG